MEDIMGDLNVTNKAQPQEHFKVKVNGNVKIQNFKGDGTLKDHQIRTTVKNGAVSNWYQWTGGKATKESHLNLNATNYNIFNAITKADKKDKKGEVLTRSDLQALKNDKQLQKKLGVVVRSDESKGVYTIQGPNNSMLYFDFD